MWWHPNIARYPTRLTNPPSIDRWTINPGLPERTDLFCLLTGMETCMRYYGDTDG